MSNPERNLEAIARERLDPKEVMDLYSGFSGLVEKRGRILGPPGFLSLFASGFRSYEIDIPVGGEEPPIHLIVFRKEGRNPEERDLMISIGGRIDGRRVELFLKPSGEAIWSYSGPFGFILQLLGRLSPESEELEPYREVLQRFQLD